MYDGNCKHLLAQGRLIHSHNDCFQDFNLKISLLLSPLSVQSDILKSFKETVVIYQISLPSVEAFLALSQVALIHWQLGKMII